MVAPEERSLTEDIPNFGVPYLLAWVGPWAIHSRTSGEWRFSDLRDQPDPTRNVKHEGSLGLLRGSGDTFGDVLVAAVPNVGPKDTACDLARMAPVRPSARVHRGGSSGKCLP